MAHTARVSCCGEVVTCFSRFCLRARDGMAARAPTALDVVASLSRAIDGCVMRPSLPRSLARHTHNPMFDFAGGGLCPPALPQVHCEPNGR